MREQLGDLHLHLCAIGGMFNIFMMMCANLVGFAVGFDGMIELSSQLLQPSGIEYLLGILFIVSVSFSLYCFVQVQFSYENHQSKSYKLIKGKRRWNVAYMNGLLVEEYI